MSDIGLATNELTMLLAVFRRYPRIRQVLLFGSRAKGTANASSDIDLAVYGMPDDLQVESLSMDLDELPLPYKYDVKAIESISNTPLLEHIKRVGVTIYKNPESC